MTSLLSNPGKVRGLTRVTDEDGHFVVLAIDHPENYLAMLNPAWQEVPAADVSRSKLGLVARFAPHASAFLLDPMWSAAQSVHAGVLPRTVGLIASVERLSYTPDGRFAATSELRPGWSVEKAKRMGADAVKMVFWWRPDAPNAAEILRVNDELVAECARHDIALIVEPLWYPGPDGGDGDRTEILLRAAEVFTRAGIDVLKSEFPVDLSSAAGRERAPDALAELDAATGGTPWVLLSGSVPYDVFAEQVELASRAGASGFMAGRAIWGDAVRAHQAGDTETVEEAVGRLRELGGIVRRFGRPWREVPAVEEVAAAVAPDWYEGY